MPNKNYRRGKTAEYRARDALVARGYTITQAGASKGAADLVAYRGGITRFIQCKRQKKPMKKVSTIANAYKKDIDALANLCLVTDTVTTELWVYVDRNGFRRFTIDLLGEIEEIGGVDTV